MKNHKHRRYVPGDILEQEGLYGLVLAVHDTSPEYTIWLFREGLAERIHFNENTGERKVA